MDRQEAFATDRMWSGVARTEVGMVSGWHHHGEYETTIYVLTGGLKMEFGPDGSTTVEAGPGDFLYVPKEVVHRKQSLRGAGRHRRGSRWSGGVHDQSPLATVSLRLWNGWVGRRWWECRR